MKEASPQAGSGADVFPAIRRQHHATLQLCENRSVARSVASSKAENHQNGVKRPQVSLFQPKPAPGWVESGGRYTSIS
jgi:hypothetical protein